MSIDSKAVPIWSDWISRMRSLRFVENLARLAAVVLPAGGARRRGRSSRIHRRFDLDPAAPTAYRAADGTPTRRQLDWTPSGPDLLTDLSKLDDIAA